MIEIGEQFQALVHQGMTGAAVEIDQHPDAAGRVRAMKQQAVVFRLGHVVGVSVAGLRKETSFKVSLVHENRSVNAADASVAS
jgi:hypothetical protein